MIRPLLAIALIAGGCGPDRLAPDTVHVGYLRGGVDGLTSSSVPGFAGEPFEASSDFDAQAALILFGWSIGPSPRSSARTLDRLELRIAHLEALLRAALEIRQSAGDPQALAPRPAPGPD